MTASAHTEKTIMYRLTLLAIALCLFVHSLSADDRLKGTVIGTKLSLDHTTNNASTTVNTCANAFDGNLSTFFASYASSNTWVGLDLGQEHIITGVAWAPRNNILGPQQVCLGLFEGSNRPDFLDAVPLYLIPERTTAGQLTWAEVQVSRGFRYVRYVGPHDAHCNIAEVAFYGHPGTGDNTHYYQITSLPTLSIHIVDDIEPYDKEDELQGWFTSIYDDGSRQQQKPVLTRLRGNKSLSFPKKPYRIRFENSVESRILPGSPLASPAKADTWTLINNYGDKSLMRNAVAMEISRRMGMAYTPYCQPVDLIVNGEYKGCYQLCDQIDIGKGRVDIDVLTRHDDNTETITGGYLIEVDGYAEKGTLWFNTKRETPITIKSPQKSEITQAQKAYISQHVNEMEQRLFAANYTDAAAGYRALLDVNSFVRHLLVNELSGNPDTYWSTYMWKQRGDDKLYVGPVWDFDLAFENDNRVYPINSHAQWLYQYSTIAAGKMRDNVNRLLSDPYVEAQMRSCWQEARDNGRITPEALTQYVDAIAAELEESQQLNFKRWNILNTIVHQNPLIEGSYEGEVSRLRTYLTDRIEWMDRKLQYSVGTAISSVDSTKPQHIAIYDTQGRRHNQLQQGINIVRMSDNSVKKVIINNR